MVGIEWVAGRVDAHVGPDEHMVAYAHLGLVEYREIEVKHHVVAHMDIAAIIATERLVGDYTFAARAQNRTEQRVEAVHVAGMRVIILADFYTGLDEFVKEGFVAGLVYFAIEHFLPFCGKFFIFLHFRVVIYSYCKIILLST